jgi:uncharacterized membrane protein YraQ (UPF0718 family)
LTATDTATAHRSDENPTRRRLRLGSVGVLVVLIVLAIVGRHFLAGLIASPRPAAVATVFASMMLQGLPFLLIGALASGLVREFVAPGLLRRWLHARGLLARPYAVVPVAAVAAVVPTDTDDATPGPTGAGLAYALAAPALSPVVLVATAVAFPGQPLMVLARALAGVVVAIGMGLLWQRFGRAEWLEGSGRAEWLEMGGRVEWLDRQAAESAPDEPAGFWTYMREQVVRAGGVLAIGAFVTALLTVAAPPGWTRVVADRSVFSVIALALLAVLVCVPAAAGPAVAAGLTAFSPVARLVFLVVGPAVNLRRFGRQSIVYGPSFSVRFAPATLVLAIVVTSLIGVAL